MVPNNAVEHHILCSVNIGTYSKNIYYECYYNTMRSIYIYIFWASVIIYIII